MNRQILVPLDGSTLAEAVLPQATALARAMSSSLTLVRVVPEMTLTGPLEGAFPFPTTSGVWEAYEREMVLAQEYLANAADRLRTEKLLVEVVVLQGDPARSIVHYAEGHPYVKLIAMSTHARTGLGRLVLGSVAEQVLHDSPVPLLLVHPDGADTSFGTFSAAPKELGRKILVPLDGSAFAEHALEQAKSLATDLDASLVLLTVLATEYDVVMVEGSAGGEWRPAPWEGEAEWAVNYLGEVARRLRLEQIAVEAHTAFGDPAEEILKAAAKSGADMVVMSTHGRSGLPRLWLGSVAMKVVQGSARPVLLARSKERVDAPELNRYPRTDAPELNRYPRTDAPELNRYPRTIALMTCV